MSAAAALLAAALGAWPAQSAPGRGLAAVLDARVAALEGEADTEIRVGVAVERADGAPVYRWRADEGFVLASNVKLLTTAACLRALPADFRWRTEARLEGAALWIRGTGDPSLRTIGGVDWPARFLDALAAQLRERGVDGVAEVVLDDRPFDRAFRHPAWPEEQWSAEYAAGIAALAVEGACVELVLPGDGTAALRPPLDPPLALDARSDNSGRDLVLAWSAADAAARLRGDLRRPLAAPQRLAVRDPLAMFGRWVAAGLKARGIAVGGVRLVRAGEAAPAGEPVFLWSSVWTLAEAVTVCNKDSDNFVAEMLLRTLGAQKRGAGTVEAGLAAARASLEELGLDPAAFALADGSGLARTPAGDGNCAAPAALCALLRAMATTPVQRVFFHSLPVGGEEGKVRDRFRAAVFQPRRVRAKTGWIRGASALSGYALAPDDSVLTFSILVNYAPAGERTNNRRFRDLQEEILAEVLGRWTRR